MRERCCKSDAALNWSDLFVFDEHQMFQLKQETFKMSLDLQWGLRVLSSIVFFSLSLMESACTGECYGNFTKSSLRLINVMPAFPQLISSLSLRCFFFYRNGARNAAGQQKKQALSLLCLNYKWPSLLLTDGVTQLSMQIQYHFSPERIFFSLPLKRAQIVYHTQLLWLCAFLMVIAGSWKQSAVPNTHCMLTSAEL